MDSLLTESLNTSLPEFLLMIEVSKISENETAPEQFEWDELNRAVEILRFFDWVAADFLRNIDPKIIAELKLILILKLSDVILRKYQLTAAEGGETK